ncbi:MAG: TraR/DksA family transcriptional regulator [Gammaproteobacteria bacterium]|nr:TraR/DksA family transcriptional regulator [Gammaproteobacteria bacterium]
MPSLQSTIDRLQALRSELTQRIDSIDTDIHHKKEPVEKDFAEQVTQRENDEVLNAIDEETQQTVFLIDKALAQIKAGSYGICSICGEKIAEQRLQALPYATTCINCAE